jgi:hypothetical protein
LFFVCVVVLCYESLFFEYFGSPDMKRIGTQAQYSVVMEESKETWSSEIVFDLNPTLEETFSFQKAPWPEPCLNRCRYIWRRIELRAQRDFKTDATWDCSWFSNNNIIANIYTVWAWSYGVEIVVAYLCFLLNVQILATRRILERGRRHLSTILWILTAVPILNSQWRCYIS